MKILIDKDIPFIQGVLEPFAEVLYLSPDEFTPASVHDADALIIRTRTKVNQTLLEGSNVRFIATATIGYDHIDTAYCDEHHIFWTACPGCNAQAVCDYIEEALTLIEPHLPKHDTTCSKAKQQLYRVINGLLTGCYRVIQGILQRPYSKVIGIVGVGHVGSLVAQMAKQKGYRIMLCDPPKHIGVSLDEIARICDIITFHTPLTADGDYPTFHLCDAAFLDKCKPNVVIINAARGGIVDESALLDKLTTGHIGGAVLDCWENEPNINPSLLLSPRLLAGSMHIAGYSLQGKWNATQMCLDALASYFRMSSLAALPLSSLNYGDSAKGWLSRISATLKSSPAQFESLRKHYPLRSS
ncbi:MAG: 4-phosphoerythronate dehydrogenase [Paludibacteraceae bacterium]|nr:4-phosphoerythronate dehydrogenase [Paludibacteraceae bacterium]